MDAGSWTLRKGAAIAAGGLALPLLLLPSSASAADIPTVVPVTTFAATSSQCVGPTYLPLLYEGGSLGALAAEIAALEGQPPGSVSVPTISSCTPLPTALSPVVGSASVSSVASPDGSATVTAQATGNELVEQSAQMDTTLSAAIPLSAPASSVVVSIPYTTTGLSQTGGNDAFALVAFGQAPGAITCVDGSYGLWSLPPGQYDISAPVGPGSGTDSVRFFCPDGSELAPGVVGLGADLLTWAHSDNGQTASALGQHRAARRDRHDQPLTRDGMGSQSPGQRLVRTMW